MINVDIKSQWKGEEIKIQGKKVINKTAYEIGLVVEGQAKLLAARDTGRLAASITTAAYDRRTKIVAPATLKDAIDSPTEPFKTEVLVGTATDYAVYQEFGTKKMDAQPFLRPAFDLAKGKGLTIFMNNGKLEFKDYLQRPE